MSLKEQVEKARIALARAKDLKNVAEFNTKDTRYGLFEDKPKSEKDPLLAKLKAASKKVNEAQKYYDNLLASFAKEEERKKITGEQEGVSEEKQAIHLVL